MRRISVADAMNRVQVENLPAVKGLKTRTSTLAWRTQVHEAPILACGIQIIDQQAHPHAAVRGEAHVMQECAAWIHPRE